MQNKRLRNKSFVAILVEYMSTFPNSLDIDVFSNSRKNFSKKWNLKKTQTPKKSMQNKRLRNKSFVAILVEYMSTFPNSLDIDVFSNSRKNFSKKWNLKKTQTPKKSKQNKRLRNKSFVAILVEYMSTFEYVLIERKKMTTDSGIEVCL